MNSSNYRFSLDMHRAKSQISIPVMLGDTNRALHIILSDGGKPYIIEDGFIAKITIKRPTGTHIEDFCAIENNTTIVYQFSQNENTAAVAGLHECDITLYDQDGRIITSPEFSMVVNERILKYDDVTLTDEDFTAVDAMIAKEASRQNNEANRVSAEADRAAAETARATAESERSSAEALRISAESERATAESGRVQAESQRVDAEATRRAAEADRVSAEAAREVKVNNAVNTSNQAKETATNAAQTANNLSNTVNQSISGFRAEIGTDALTFGQATVKGAVNHAMNTAEIAKNQSDANRSNITNLSAQVNGIGRTYVVATFLDFIDFLNSTKSIPLSEDRDGNGGAELYSIFVSDLKTGDNIIIKETGVPDFWFEKNSSLSSFDKYTYNGKEYTLSAKKNGATVGGSHILETDYTVIEGYALSASGFAVDAANSAARALQSENNAKASYNSAKAESDKAKASEEAAKVSETEAANSASAAHAYLQEAKAVEANMENLSSGISRNDKRITNLEQGIPPSLFQTDDTVAYSKSVPENARSYAMINSIGGMTRKSTNLIPFPYRDGQAAGATHTENGITFTVNEDYSITLNGTSTDVASFAFSESSPDTIRLVAGAKYSIGTGLKDTNIRVYLAVKDASGNTKYFSNTSSPFTWLAEYKIHMAFLQIENTGTVCNNITIYPMLNEGTEALPYEPYFEGLRSAPVTAVESIGKNILNEQWEIGTLGSNGANNNTTDTIRSGYVSVVGGTRYYFYSTDTLTVCWYDASKNFISVSYLNDTNGRAKYAPSNARYIRVSPYQYGTTYKHDICVNVYNTAINGTYIPSIYNTLPIPEAVQAIDGYGEGASDFYHNYIDWGKKQFVKMVEKIVLNGSETWTASSATSIMQASIRTLPKNAGDVEKGAIASNGYRFFNKYVSDASVKPYFRIYENANQLYVEATLEQFASVDAWKAHLAANPVEIIYPLATPEVTDISDILPDDNYIAVEGSGTLTMVNEHGYAVPSEITYQIKGVTV